MSDAVSNSDGVEDVEDVLSSIKRLVTATGTTQSEGSGDDASPAADETATGTPETIEEKPGALLLTSALRVPPQNSEHISNLESLRQSVSETIDPENDAEESVPDASEAPAPDAKTADASLHWIAPAPLGEYYEDEAADGEAIIGQAQDAPTETEERASAEVLQLTPAFKSAEERRGPEADQSAELDETDGDAAGDNEAEHAEAEVVAEKAHETLDTHAEATPELSADADLDPNESEETAHFSSVDESAIPGGDPDAIDDDDWNLQDLEDDELVHTSADQFQSGLSDAKPWEHPETQSMHAAAEAAAEPWDDVVAAGHAPFTREEDDAEVEGIATFVRSGREVTYTEVEAHDVDDLSYVPEAETIDVQAVDAEDDPLAAGVFDEDVLDEEALREMVAEIVREELTGALGERITRNVRKLVRREINRALTAQDLE
ncbi:MAG: hypothetical protein AAF340_16575 [Pseudomonadota bacterium]